MGGVRQQQAQKSKEAPPKSGILGRILGNVTEEKTEARVE